MKSFSKNPISRMKRKDPYNRAKTAAVYFTPRKIKLSLTKNDVGQKKLENFCANVTSESCGDSYQKNVPVGQMGFEIWDFKEKVFWYAAKSAKRKKNKKKQKQKTQFGQMGAIRICHFSRSFRSKRQNDRKKLSHSRIFSSVSKGFASLTLRFA